MSYRGIGEKFDAAYEIKRQLRDLRELTETSALPLNLTAVSVRDIRSGAVPPAPTNFTALAGAGVVALTWDGGNISNLSHYQLQISLNPAFADADSFNTTNSFWTFDEGTVGTTYYFRVRTVNLAGTPSVWTATLNAAPTAFTSGETPGAPGSVVLFDSMEFASNTYDSDTRLGDITLSDTYSMLEIELVDLVVNTDAVDLYMQFYFDGTAKAANYRQHIAHNDTGGTFYSRTGANSQNQLALTHASAQLGTGAGESLSGTIWLFTNPVLNSSQQDPIVVAELILRDDGGATTRVFSGGRNNNNSDTDLTGFKLYPSTGVFSSGRIRVYGWKIA